MDINDIILVTAVALHRKGYRIPRQESEIRAEAIDEFAKQIKLCITCGCGDDHISCNDIDEIAAKLLEHKEK